jgi:JmjC domain
MPWSCAPGQPTSRLELYEFILVNVSATSSSGTFIPDRLPMSGVLKTAPAGPLARMWRPCGDHVESSLDSSETRARPFPSDITRHTIEFVLVYSSFTHGILEYTSSQGGIATLSEEQAAVGDVHDPSTAEITAGKAGASLAWLIDPVAPEVFAAEYWEQAPLFVSRPDVNYFAGLPGLNEVDELISATSSRSPGLTEDVRIIKTDEKGALSVHPPRVLASGLLDIQAIYYEYQNGCSLAINHLQRRSASIASLCGLLESDLHHPVGANLYLTPRYSQGFRPHVDTHDVFILQVHGTKDWFYSTPVEDLPLPSMKPVVDYQQTDFQGITMRPGDVLYLPRGFPHYAKTTETSSLHYTVGIEPYRWIDYMTEALQEIAHSSVKYRHALPPGFFDLPVDNAVTVDFAEMLTRRLRDEVFVERVKQRLEAYRLRASKATSTGHFASLDNSRDLTIESIVTHVPGVHCRVRETGDSAIIDFTENFVSGPVFLAPSLRFVAKSRTFAIKDLPGSLSIADKIDLVERLISEGLLRICRMP